MGIDLGTTYSCVGIFKDGEAVVSWVCPVWHATVFICAGTLEGSQYALQKQRTHDPVASPRVVFRCRSLRTIRATGRASFAPNIFAFTPCTRTLRPSQTYIHLRTPSYVAWTENERLLGDAAKNQAIIKLE